MKDEETFLRARARRLLSSFPGMESMLSLAHLNARFCKETGISEALTRTFRRSFCSSCSIAFFFCMRLLKNLLLLSSSCSAPSISLFHLSLSHSLDPETNLRISGYCWSPPFGWKKVHREKMRREREGEWWGKTTRFSIGMLSF